MPSKRDAQRRHARRRALERYGLELGAGTRARILEAIHTGRSKLVQRQSHRVVVHDVKLDGRTVRVVYDKSRGELVTFLPADRPVVRLRELVAGEDRGAGSTPA